MGFVAQEREGAVRPLLGRTTGWTPTVPTAGSRMFVEVGELENTPETGGFRCGSRLPRLPRKIYVGGCILNFSSWSFCEQFFHDGFFYVQGIHHIGAWSCGSRGEHVGDVTDRAWSRGRVRTRSEGQPDARSHVYDPHRSPLPLTLPPRSSRPQHHTPPPTPTATTPRTTTGGHP